MKLLYAALCAFLLVGCGHGSGSTKIPPPPSAQCEDALCRAPCVGEDGDTGIRWDGTPTDPAAFEALADEVTMALADALRQCETRRKACDQCLDRLDAAGVIIR